MSTQARQFKPETDLQRSVDAFWFHATDMVDGAAAGPAMVYPDGCIDLIFRERRVGGLIVEARLFVVGASETAYSVTPQAGESFVGVRFRPGMSRLFVDADPVALLGRDVTAANIEPRFSSLEAKLADTASPEAALEVLRNAVANAAHARRGRVAPERARSAIALLGLLDSELRVAAVAETVGTSVRSLRRDVIEWTGLSPVMLSRIFRFQAALEMILTSPRRPLTAIAFEAGYADHPHMTREFRALANITPSTLHA